MVKKKISSYQKLKEENKKLRQDIYSLVRSADKIEGKQVWMRYDMLYRMSDIVWFGDSEKSKDKESVGILGMMQESMKPTDDIFKWADGFPLEEKRNRGKLESKIPMKQKVITEDGEVWEYYKDGEKLHWTFLCQIIPIND